MEIKKRLFTTKTPNRTKRLSKELSQKDREFKMNGIVDERTYIKSLATQAEEVCRQNKWSPYEITKDLIGSRELRRSM
jgi:hypothetical protein